MFQRVSGGRKEDGLMDGDWYTINDVNHPDWIESLRLEFPETAIRATETQNRIG